MAMKASVLIAALWLTACGHAAIVQNPAPIHAAPSVDATEQAILDALPRHGWSVEDVRPGRIVAFLSIRSHLLRCEITYDAEKVRVEYLDSDRLDAQRTKSGSLYAHRHVNTWMTTLARDIQTSLAKTPAAPALAAPEPLEPVPAQAVTAGSPD